MQDLNTLQRKSSAHGDHVGTYPAAVQEHPLPWTKMRQVYHLALVGHDPGAKSAPRQIAHLCEPS